ncbi:HPP family protein [Psychrobium sp. MM17-31]|uniref:HPP family protein n=1 Tax=Psychrobium sp. MM17-31 TaxID=2917758 RepID=UPI001EF4085B|nr:HPP family protein [Psychrobium sp. MM17-31]MCG7531067.1 HPP family protein [Psychrobium sp. MM17-31]
MLDRDSLIKSVFAGVGAAVAIGLLAWLDTLQTGLMFLMAPLGASAVLVFGVPDSPLAQPKNVIFGHFLTAVIGVTFVVLFPVTPITIALATGLGVSGMLMTKTTHPPAGANPILILMAGAGWPFLLFPVFVGAIAIVLIGKVFAEINKQVIAKPM